ncbi:ankyrin repeat domain-containing protein [Bacillus sp. SM2101]|uniref:ankyrin repeat domain-containing protein n=1 Tax=Bacillus sp. SM2101 TaxID=2805366 RepID=UPI001BDE91F1
MGYLHIVNVLLLAGIDPNNDNRPLNGAVSYGHFDIVKALLEAGADPNHPNQQTKRGKTPLFEAVYLTNTDNQLKFVRELHRAGANINHQDHYGDTALIIAGRDNRLQIIKKLLEYGINPNMQNHKGDTALIEACRAGNVEVVEALIQAEVNIKIKNKKWLSAKYYAKKNKDQFIIKLLK